MGTLAHHTDTLAHVHPQRKRSCREGRRHRHPPGPSGPPTEVQMDSEPESLPTQKVHSPLIGNHAPSGWLRDRGSGLRTRPWYWYPDAAARTSPSEALWVEHIIYNGGLSEHICEQQCLPMRVLGSEPIFPGPIRVLGSEPTFPGEFPDVFYLDTSSHAVICLDTFGRPKTPAPRPCDGDEGR